MQRVPVPVIKHGANAIRDKTELSKSCIINEITPEKHVAQACRLHIMYSRKL